MPGAFMGAHSTFPQPSAKTSKASSTKASNSTSSASSFSSKMSSSSTEKLLGLKSKLGFHSKGNSSYGSLASTYNEKDSVHSGSSSELTDAQRAKLDKYRAVNKGFKDSQKRTPVAAFTPKGHT